MSAIAGRVLLIPKGAYNALTTYNPLDFVTYGANSYVCKQTSTGNAPTNTTYWQLMAQGATNADNISYDGTASGLASTDVQGAIDEVVGEIGDTNDAISAITNVYGAKNLLPNEAVSQTVNGVTFTVNADKSISTSGTASGSTPIVLSKVHFKVGSYILTGCPSGGSVSTYNLVVDTQGYDTGAGFSFTINSETDLDVKLIVETGTNVTGKTFYPMLRDSRIPDATYQPFSKTNQALTNDKAERTDLSDIIINGTTNNTGSTITTGTYFYLNGAFCRALADVANGATFTLNTNYETTTIGGSLSDCSVVSSTTITTYATGVQPLTGEEVKCIKYSNGTIIITGLLTTTAEVAADTQLFQVPVGYRKSVLPSTNYWMPICLNNNTIILGRYIFHGLNNWSAAIPSGVRIPIYIVL